MFDPERSRETRRDRVGVNGKVRPEKTGKLVMITAR